MADAALPCGMPSGTRCGRGGPAAESKTGSDGIIRPVYLALDLNMQSLIHGSDRFDLSRSGSRPPISLFRSAWIAADYCPCIERCGFGAPIGAMFGLPVGPMFGLPVGPMFGLPIGGVLPPVIAR